MLSSLWATSVRRAFVPVVARQSPRPSLLAPLGTVVGPTAAPWGCVEDGRRWCSSLTSTSTVFALSSGVGKAAIAVVRVTGEEALVAAQQLGARVDPWAADDARTVKRTRLRHPVTKERLDDALVVWFPGPNSFSGEDVVEFHLHGGRAVVDGVLRALSSIPGLEPARPGEFTKRAFLNGKMDLTEVEGIADLINADTDAQRRQALQQMDGVLGQLYSGWRMELLACLAHAEAVIDFGEDEDDCNDEVYAGVADKVQRLVKDMKRHLDDGRRGEIIREGVRMVIAGSPNVGKSSFLNVLADRPAAIVSSIPGTTRDVVEVAFDLGGYPVVVSDTAGVRATDDVIEKEGVRRALDRSAAADVLVVVCDASSPTVEDAVADDVRALCADGGPSLSVLLMNKSDVDGPLLSPAAVADYLNIPSSRAYSVSCKTLDGVPTLMTDLEQVVATEFDSAIDTQEGDDSSSGAVITRTRHRHHLTACVAALDNFMARTEEVDMAAEELRIASRELGVLTGRVGVEEMLDKLFADFCIGK